MMTAIYIIVCVAIVGVSVYFLVRELRKEKEENVEKKEGVLVIPNKRQIERSVQNLESMIVLADGNDTLTNKLVELKDEIRFLNPSSKAKVKQVDEKIANKLDDIKIEMSKDLNSEVIFRMIEEVEGFLSQRTKEMDA